FAVPALMRTRRPFMVKYHSSVANCRELVVRMLSKASNLALVPPAGGFYVSVRWTGPERDEEQLLINLLKDCKILAHPGDYYDMAGTHIVMTFVEDAEVLGKALEGLLVFADQ